MSAIAFNWVPFEIETEVETPAMVPRQIRKEYSREKEFRTALDSYMAGYREHSTMIANKNIH